MKFFFLESPTKYVIILVVTVTVKGPHPNDCDSQSNLPRMNHSQTHSCVGITKHEFNLGPSFHQANYDKQESLAKTLCYEFFLSLEPLKGYRWAWNPSKLPARSLPVSGVAKKPLSEACEAFSSYCG